MSTSEILFSRIGPSMTPVHDALRELRDDLSQRIDDFATSGQDVEPHRTWIEALDLVVEILCRSEGNTDDLRSPGVSANDLLAWGDAIPRDDSSDMTDADL